MAEKSDTRARNQETRLKKVGRQETEDRRKKDSPIKRNKNIRPFVAKNTEPGSNNIAHRKN